MASIRQTGASDAQDAVYGLVHEIGRQVVAFLIANDAEEIIVEIVAHLVLDVLVLGPVDDPAARNDVERSPDPNIHSGSQRTAKIAAMAKGALSPEA